MHAVPLDLRLGQPIHRCGVTPGTRRLQGLAHGQDVPAQRRTAQRLIRKVQGVVRASIEAHLAIAIRGTDHQALPFSDDKRSFPIPDAQPVKSGFGLDPQGQRSRHQTAPGHRLGVTLLDTFPHHLHLAVSLKPFRDPTGQFKGSADVMAGQQHGQRDSGDTQSCFKKVQHAPTLFTRAHSASHGPAPTRQMVLVAYPQ